MKNFIAGINNFWVGLVTGLMLPIIVLALVISSTVSQVTNLIQDSAIEPIVSRSEQTFDKVDRLLVTLDDKVDHADLKDLELLAPLKNMDLLPELQLIAGDIHQLKQAISEVDKQAVITNLQERLQQSLANKFPEEKAQQLCQNLVNITHLLASQTERLPYNEHKKP